MKPIYLDYNATTPIDSMVAEAMLPFIHEHFGNPSSSHVFGATARKAVENSRRLIAEMLGCRAEDIVFTSGGTESNNYAIKGAAFAAAARGNHIITSSVEHPAVIEVCRFLAGKGFRITYLPVDEHGIVDPELVERAITPETILVSIMHANNEVGTVEPIGEIAEIVRHRGVLFHTDAAQSIGKIPVNVEELGVDLLSVAGHKLYAPKGIGALYIRSGTQLEKLIHGANHEMNLRAGTENTIYIVGLGEAFQIIHRNLRTYQQHMLAMRDRLEAGLAARFPDIRINGHPSARLPNTSSISFRAMAANSLISELTDVAVSAGAACHSDHMDISSVLKAMHVPVEYAMGTIRFSVGRYTVPEDIDRAVERVVRAVGKIRTGPY